MSESEPEDTPGQGTPGQADTKPEDVLRRNARLYGLTRDEVIALFEHQQKRCAVCRSLLDGKVRIDHDHDVEDQQMRSGKRKADARRCAVRALLCASCNTREGNVRTKIKEVAYLRQKARELRDEAIALEHYASGLEHTLEGSVEDRRYAALHHLMEHCPELLPRQ
jgi:hypothetical protein